jgi:AbrB family looped-hinge helix DNA binding protein
VSVANCAGKTYLTNMNAQTKMSAKGQVVIPKAVRDRFQWGDGADLEVVERADGVLLRSPAPKRERISIEEFRRRVPPHDGPALTLEEIDAALAQGMAEHFRKEYKLGR